MYGKMKQHLCDALAGLKDAGLYKEERIIEGPQQAEILVKGKKVLNFCANNYLGLSNHPRLIEGAKNMMDKRGFGMSSVRFICGTQDSHKELEAAISDYFKTEDTILYAACFDANGGVFGALFNEEDAIISDALNHASIIDGTRLSKADKAVFQHSDMADLERVLKEKRNNYNNVLIITDGVFSMDGDIAKLPEIVALAEKYNCLTYVDDAHSSGVLGESGRGTVDHFKLHGRVDVAMGTLSKAIGVVGGYVAGKKVTIDWLKNRGRPFLFSTGLPPAAVGAAIEAVKMLMESTEYTDKLWANAKHFKEGLGKLGYNIGHSETPITPIIIGDEAKTLEFSKKLFENGLFSGPIVFPTVPKGTGRVRCMVTAGHTTEQLDRAVKICEKVGKEMGII